jgi:Uma2 family endonuclease
MGAQIATSIEDYLRTSYPDVDREYRNGEVVERSMPDYLHGKVQILLGIFFGLLRKRFPFFPSVETRLRMGPDKVLIPDVTVFYPEEPSRQPDTPPFIAIEILSIDDKLSAVREKLEEYRIWGISHVWLVDPHARRLYTCEPGLTEVTTLRIPELEIELKAADVFDWQ